MNLTLIPKYQQGGAYTPPYAYYTASPSLSETTSTAQSAGSTSSSGSKGLTDKDLITMLEKLDGLPSDMDVLMKGLRGIFTVDPLGLSSGSTASTARKYLTALENMKIANFNKKEYDNAYNQVSKNGGINEFAINDRGQFVCANAEGDFQLMTAEQLKESNGEYSPLTNSELLYYRAHDDSLANNNKFLSIVQNGIGMEVVTKMIQDAVSHLGTSENSNEGYVSTEKGRIIRGMEDFQRAVQQAAGNLTYDGTVNDLYKYKYLTKNQADQAQQAMAYIYNTLPANARALLKSKSDLTEKGAQQLIQTLIASRLDNTQQFDINLVGGVSHKTAGSGSSTEKDTTKMKDSQLVEIMQGIGGVKQPMTIDRGDGIQMSLTGRMYNMISGTDGKPIGNTSLGEMMLQSGLQGILDNNQNITFGDQKITMEDLNNITYNNKGVMRAILPKNPDGSVDLEVLDAYQRAEAKIEELGNDVTPEKTREIYDEVGLGDLLLANGQPNPDRFGAFLVTEGYTTDGLVDIKPSNFVKEYTGDTNKAADYIKKTLTTGTGKDKVVPKIDVKDWYNIGDWLGFYDRIYKAAIYIPITNSTLLAVRTGGQQLDYDEALSLEQRYQDYDKRVGQQTTSSTVLDNED